MNRIIFMCVALVVSVILYAPLPPLVTWSFSALLRESPCMVVLRD